MYSVVLSLRVHPRLRQVDQAHQYVISRLVEAVRQQVAGVQWQGTCDLTYRERKFSGNSLRISRDHLLYHGTILHDADLSLIDRCLAMPPRQPGYRRDRRHRDFLVNIPLCPRRLADDLAEQFEAVATDQAWPEATVERLLKQRYRDARWHQRH